MKTEYPLSKEEEKAIKALGGFDRAAHSADRVLREHGFQRPLFTRTEQRYITSGRDESQL